MIRAGINSQRTIYANIGHGLVLDLEKFWADRRAWVKYHRNPHTQEARARTKPFSQTRSR